jgi:hypothetical protein
VNTGHSWIRPVQSMKARPETATALRGSAGDVRVRLALSSQKCRGIAAQSGTSRGGAQAAKRKCRAARNSTKPAPPTEPLRLVSVAAGGAVARERRIQYCSRSIAAAVTVSVLGERSNHCSTCSSVTSDPASRVRLVGWATDLHPHVFYFVAFCPGLCFHWVDTDTPTERVTFDNVASRTNYPPSCRRRVAPTIALSQQTPPTSSLLVGPWIDRSLACLLACSLSLSSG